MPAAATLKVPDPAKPQLRVRRTQDMVALDNNSAASNGGVLAIAGRLTGILQVALRA